jgi:hypothetical protein
MNIAREIESCTGHLVGPTSAPGVAKTRSAKMALVQKLGPVLKIMEKEGKLDKEENQRVTGTIKCCTPSLLFNTSTIHCF